MSTKYGQNGLGESSKTLIGYYVMSLSYEHKGEGIVVFLIFLGLVLWSGFWTIRHFIAEVYCNTVTNSTMNRDQSPSLEKVKRAIFWDSSNEQYWNKLAQELIRMRNANIGLLNGDNQNQIRRQMEIINAIEKAVRLNPFNTQYHLKLGWEYTHLWNEPDYHKKWLPAADVSMERAAYFAGDKYSRLHVELGNYWVMRSTTILPSNSKHQDALSRACWHYKKAQSLEAGGELKRVKKKIRDYMWNFYPDEGMIKQTIQ